MENCYVSPRCQRFERDEFRHVCVQGQLIDHPDGHKYCFLHFPGKKDRGTFEKSLAGSRNDVPSVGHRKPDRSDFRGVYFSDLVHFGGNESFKNEAKFQLATFAEDLNLFTSFNNGGNFSRCTFMGTLSVSEAEITGHLYFYQADFHGMVILGRLGRFDHDASIRFDFATIHSESTFYVNDAGYDGMISFQRAAIKGSLEFAHTEGGTGSFGDNFVLDLQNASISFPAKISFQNVRLKPSWFINVDSREFSFTNVEWENVGRFAEKNVRAEVDLLGKRGVPNALQLLKVVYWHLAENAENNNRFDEASNFRRMAFESERIGTRKRISTWVQNLVPESQKLKRRFAGSTDEKDNPTPPTDSFGILRRSGDLIIHELYRITSFYGESWSRAFVVLFSLILLIFPIIYTQTSFQTCSTDRPIAASLTICESKDEEIRRSCTCSTRQITFADAIMQSLTTATLQNVEYRKPLAVWGEIWIILEKIFAPLQAALLALAIRRKFMR